MKASYPLVLIAASLQLTACGEGSDSGSSNTANATISPVNAFESALTTKLDTQTEFNIPSKTGTDAQLAYSVHSKIFRDSTDHYKTLVFDLSTNIYNQTLTVDLDPVTNQYNLMTIQIDPIKNTDVFSKKYFYCNRIKSDTNSYPICHATVNYDNQTGTTNIKFNPSKITNGSDDFIILNGALKGTLSITPNTVKSIPVNAAANIAQSSWYLNNDYSMNINAPITSIEYINNNQKLYNFGTWSALIVNEKTIGNLTFEKLVIDPKNAEIITRLLILDYSCNFETCKNVTLTSTNMIQINKTPLFWKSNYREDINTEITASGTIQLY